MHFLEEIVESTRQEVERRKASRPLKVLQGELAARTGDRFFNPRGFKRSISAPGKVNLIAEIKKASPSRGIIREDFEPLAIARIYQENQAAALSVLTEERFFLGSLSYIDLIRKEIELPVLRKDFIVDIYQLYEARAAGADAVLLIVRILSEGQLKDYLSEARKLDLDCLVEVHNAVELKAAENARAEIIGINNRDLDTFEIDLGTTAKLAKLLDKSAVVVSESGIHSREDLKFLADQGVNAILIGEAFMVSPDIAGKMKEIMSL